jgi:AhpC/TSA family
VIALWIAVVVVGAGVLFLAFALAGSVRRLDELRREVAALADGASPMAGMIEHPPAGLPVGTPAPPFGGPGPDGGTFASSALRGRRHLVVFAETGCAACHDLVPGLVEAADLGPIVVVTGPGDEPWPDGWGTADERGDRVRVVSDPAGDVAAAFHTGFTPHVFVVDEGDSIAAQGPADSVAAVRSLLADADQIQIVRTEPVDG